MFSETLEISLSLEIKGKKFEVPGGNITSLDLEIESYGFRGHIGFGIFAEASEDQLFSSFITHDLIKVELSINRMDRFPDTPPVPLDLCGLVTEKSLGEVVVKNVKNQSVVERRYEIKFKDAAQVLWKQHFPIKLFTQTTLKAMIQDQVVEHITIDLEAKALEKGMDMICLGLDREKEAPNFYDFLVWLTRRENMVLAYDYKTAKLRLSDNKTVPRPESLIRSSEVEDLSFAFSAPHRHGIRILNAYSESPKTDSVDHEHALTGITRDCLLRTPIAEQADERKKLETSRLDTHPPLVNIRFKTFPRESFHGGCMVKFPRGDWEKSRMLTQDPYRVISLHLLAQAEDPRLSEDYNAPATGYKVNLSAVLEPRDAPPGNLPPAGPAPYPVLVEGKIVSESGEDSDKTYQFSTNETTSLDQYEVHIPLWNLKVKAPFIPGVFTGHFYFPAFKHARVVTALFLDRAEIVGFLDWGEGARLPMDAQGNHILFGKNNESQTSMKYLYEEGRPVFSIHRTSDKDTELIRMEEDAIVLQTKEED